MTVEPTLAMMPTASVPPTSGAPPGADPPPGETLFQSTLAEQSARTANAEGHQNKSEEGSGDNISGRRSARGLEADGTAAAEAGAGAQVSAPQRIDHQAAAASSASSAAPSPRQASQAANAHLDGAATAIGVDATPEGSTEVGEPVGPSTTLDETSAAPEIASPATSSAASTIIGAVEEAPAGVTSAIAQQPSSAKPASTSSAAAKPAGADSTLAGKPAGEPQAPSTQPVAAAGTEGPSQAAASGPAGAEAAVSIAQAGVPQAQPSAGEAAVLAGAQAPSTVGARSDAQRAGFTPAARATANTANLSSTLPAGQPQAGGQPDAGGSQESAGEASTGDPSQTSSAAAAPAPATAAASAAAIGSESSSLQASVTQIQVQGAVAGTGAPATPAAGVGMHEMIESIRATIEIAVRQGQTQARISLQPEELGQISIHISQTSQGLLARVSADTPAAAQALAEGRSELRQSLSSLGLPLTLDISAYGESEAREPQERFSGEAAGSSGSSSSQSSEDGDGEPVAALAGAATPAAIDGGTLVDVLA